MLPLSKRQNKAKYNKPAPVVCSMLRKILQEVVDVCHIGLEVILYSDQSLLNINVIRQNLRIFTWIILA